MVAMALKVSVTRGEESSVSTRCLRSWLGVRRRRKGYETSAQKRKEETTKEELFQNGDR